MQKPKETKAMRDARVAEMSDVRCRSKTWGKKTKCKTADRRKAKTDLRQW